MVLRSTTLWSSMMWLLAAIMLCPTVTAYQVLFSQNDNVRQVCSGMWGKGKQDPFIEVIFGPSSRGQLALVIYEWKDAYLLGVDSNKQSTEDTWSQDRTYICTLDALSAGLCAEDQLGRFIVNSNAGNDSTIFTASVRFDPVLSAPQSSEDARLGTGPYRYAVTRTGFWCVGHVPLTLEGATRNTTYEGVVDFENVFEGHLPASEWPKVQFYFVLFLIYVGLGVTWLAMCWRHRRELLPIQNYISATVVFLAIEMMAVWRYYAYLNNDGHPGVAGLFLFVVAILNAARNSLSFFLLLITSMGYGIVRPTLGSVMLRVRMLSMIHFVFGVLYSLGTVLVPLEAAGFFIFFFVIPLAFSLTAFLMWIMWSLNSTIADLSARRQVSKGKMFSRLYRILICAVIVIFAFFVISSLSFSNRLDEDFGADTWKTRWILLDGWLSVLYLVVFFSIAFLWRPTSENRRLALSDELPTDELDADRYDVDAMESGTADDDDADKVPLRSVRAHGGIRDRDQQVVFDVGSDGEDDLDDEARGAGSRRGGGVRRSGDSARSGGQGEHQRLRMQESDDDEDAAGDITNYSGDRRGGPPPEYNSKRDD